MASGTLNLGTDNHLTGQIKWTATANGTAANTSTVKVTVQVARAYGSQYTTTGTFTGSVTIGGTTKSFSKYVAVSTSWVTLYTVSITVAHNNNGTGTCKIAGTINGPTGTTMEGRSVSSSVTVTLDTIPRFATVTSGTNFTDEGNPTIKYSNPAGSSVTAIRACISLTGSAADVPYRDISKTGTSYTFSLTEEERNTLRSAAKNSNTLSVRLYIRTYVGSNYGHSYKTVTMTIVNANPTISPTVVDTNSSTIAVTGDSSILVAGQSTAKVTINASGVKGATIKSQKVEHNGVTLTGNGTFSSVADSAIKFTATDSRGNTATKNATNTIIPYVKPTCIIGNSMPTIDGDMTLTVSGRHYNGSFGAENNSLTVQYRYKVKGGTYGSWSTISSPTRSGNKYTATKNVTGLEYGSVYVFQVKVTDALTTVTSAEKSFTSKPIFDWGKDDFMFNVPVSFNGIYGDWVSDSTDIDTLIETGLYHFKTENTSPNKPSSGALGEIISINRTDAIGTQICINDSHGDPRLLIRKRSDGAWGQWRYVNPVMTTGVEYLTLKLWKGKVVYTTQINLGTLPSSGSVSALLGTGLNVISIGGEAYSDEYVCPLGCCAAIKEVWYQESNGKIYISVNTGSDASQYTAYVVVEYTKE